MSDNEEEEVFDAQKFLFDSALYTSMSFSLKNNDASWIRLDTFFNTQTTVRGYCTDCKEETVFSLNDLMAGQVAALKREYKFNVRNVFDNIQDGFHQITGRCTIDARHKICFLIRVSTFRIKGEELRMENLLGKKFEKIGQWPSFAELSSPELRKYRKCFDNNDKYLELVKAVGLASHDSSIGAYTYLRRVFDYLVDEAHADAEKQDGWDEAEYRKKDRKDQVRSLKGFLPDFVIENAQIYTVLSMGIHTMTEEECRTYFDAVLTGIKLMLESTRSKRERERLERGYTPPSV